MEMWKKWTPLADIPSIFYIESSIDNRDGTHLIFHSDDSKKEISFLFKDGVFSYKNTNERVFLKTLDYLHEQYGIDFYSKWSLFKVENSNYLSWFQEESLSAYESQDIEHYVFYTPEDVIEVLSPYHPEVTIKDVT